MKKVTIAISIIFAFAFTVSAGHRSRNHTKHSHVISVHDTHSTYISSSSHHSSHNSHKSHHSSHSNYSTHSSGYYEYVNKRVWVEGCVERIWIPARYEYRRMPCGEYQRVVVCAGHFDNHRSQGHYQYKSVRVWRPSSRRSCNNSLITVNWSF